MYQNLSRRYRPQLFRTVVGQESIVITLKNAIKLEKIAPAYIFCGCRGTGKTTFARLFAKALNCHSFQDEPCNNCPSCLEIMQGRSLDVLEIDGASNRGIDDIRQINETVGYSTAYGKYKIYIIDEVHMLTKEAFNALLKTLEEPPSNVKFFFATTEPQKVLPTIMSRCQRFDLNRLTTAQIIKKLELIAEDLGVSIEPQALHLIAQAAEGGLRDAESIFDQLLCFASGPITYTAVAHLLGITPRHFYFQIDEAIAQENLPAAFQLSHDLFSTGRELHTFLEGLLEHFRIHLLFQLNIPTQTFLNSSEETHYQKMKSIFTHDQLLYILDYLTDWIKELNKIPFRRVTLEMIFLHLIRSIKRVSLPTLVRRLEELSSGHAPAYIKPATATVAQKPSLTPNKSSEIENSTSTPFESKTSGKDFPTETDAHLKKNEEIKQDDLMIQPRKPEITASSNIESPSRPQSHYDTILRFAAVELEGILKKG